ncbi:ligase-associated DNA damage response endonuclease PdeM [Tropicimonas isoalkanivorans]|uniref:Putative phosphoesterase n=1 Tax=Tropicimonas isoalkanivorans TaxID=441112 RepID=A0A1I1NGQ2_9RHOB|nr:ligase-associated DNA damage response endonuclease PdeM [Tropicimonas isoalkanivorans]SFC96675.1 putative phosphoesterase [Tropicimonas isoalkanivorans]
MNTLSFSLTGAMLCAMPSGALWWPEWRLLCVSDLHLGKSERIARRGGGLLPPYDSRDTLSRLDAEIARLDPATVVCLGDSFDDLAAAEALEQEARAWLTRLIAGRAWVWIEGNHDPGPLALDGSHRAELRIGGLCFRHVAAQGAQPGEVSGHYHPKACLGGGGRRVRRPCFLTDGERLILPAFGTFTGGLDITAPELRALMGPGARAILTGPTPVVFPAVAG